MLDAQNVDLNYGQSQILFDTRLCAPRGQITIHRGDRFIVMERGRIKRRAEKADYSTALLKEDLAL